MTAGWDNMAALFGDAVDSQTLWYSDWRSHAGDPNNSYLWGFGGWSGAAWNTGALDWTGVPSGARALAVICHDPDAPLVQNGSHGFVHWVLYNLPASTTSLEEGTTVGTGGLNDFGKSGYGGPMPPKGHGLHQYYFWVLALDKVTDLPEGLSLAELLKQVEPHLLGMNRLVGTYQRG